MQIVGFGRGVKRWDSAGLKKANEKVRRYNDLLAKLINELEHANRASEGPPRHVLVKQAPLDMAKHMMKYVPPLRGQFVHGGDHGSDVLTSWRAPSVSVCVCV